MSRVQIALNVTNVDAAVAFYSKLLGTEPAKYRSGYANFSIAEPPLKLVLIENTKVPGGTLNHLGIEVETPMEVAVASDRLETAGLELEVEAQVSCCYSVQEKVWARDPDGAPWEIYALLSSPTNREPLPLGEVGVDCPQCG